MGLKDYKIDQDLAIKGYWASFDGFDVCIARFSRENPALLKYLLNPPGNLTNGSEKEKRYIRKLLSQVIVTNWRTYQGDSEIATIGIEDPINGPDAPLLPVNPENISLVLKECPELATEISLISREREYYVQKVIEEETGNLLASSSGT